MPDDAAASHGRATGKPGIQPPSGHWYAASHVDLWLGAHWSAEQAAALRKLNPSTLVLTSINACEGPDGLPEELYLHNVTRPNSTRGRLESWPGAFRLDVTKPATQRYQAMLMYNLMLYGGVEAGQPPSMATSPCRMTACLSTMFFCAERKKRHSQQSVLSRHYRYRS